MQRRGHAVHEAGGLQQGHEDRKEKDGQNRVKKEKWQHGHQAIIAPEDGRRQYRPGVHQLLRRSDQALQRVKQAFGQNVGVLRRE